MIFLHVSGLISLQKEKEPRAPSLTSCVLWDPGHITMIIISDYTLVLKEDFGIFCWEQWNFPYVPHLPLLSYGTSGLPGALQTLRSRGHLRGSGWSSTPRESGLRRLSVLFHHAALDAVVCRKPYPDRRISAYGWIPSAGLRPGHPFFKSFPARCSQ